MPLDPWFTGPNLAKDNGFLLAIKICSTTSFGREEKLSVPCRKILQHVKEPYRYEKRYSVHNIHNHFSPSFSCFITRCLCWLQYYQRPLVDESGMIRMQMGIHSISGMVAVHRMPCVIPPYNSNSHSNSR
jgi:hypothetical protein